LADTRAAAAAHQHTAFGLQVGQVARVSRAVIEERDLGQTGKQFARSVHYLIMRDGSQQVV